MTARMKGEFTAARTAGDRLREAVAGLLADGEPELAEKITTAAEEYAAALLGGRHPSCARWLPRAQSTCGLAAGHLDVCISISAAVNQRMRAKKRALRRPAPSPALDTARRMGGIPSSVPAQGAAPENETGNDDKEASR